MTSTRFPARACRCSRPSAATSRACSLAAACSAVREHERRDSRLKRARIAVRVELGKPLSHLGQRDLPIRCREILIDIDSGVPGRVLSGVCR
jgi:hypothetical protein